MFKRPTSWPAYETLDRHNLFRFYDWGLVNIQENVNLDAEGKFVVREAGVITAVRIKPAATLPDTTTMPNDGNVRPRCSPGRHPP